MFKEVIFVVIHLNLLKSLANGFVVGANENNKFNQWLQPFNTAGASFKQWFVDNTYPNQNETSMQLILKDTSDTLTERNKLSLERNPEPIKHTSVSQINSSTNQSFEPIGRVLETLQAEINKADDEKKKYYIELLTDLQQKFTLKSRYVRVFFNHMWHVVDLGLYGSSQRTRDASTLNHMLKPLKDLLKWLYKNFIDLLNWNIATDYNDENHRELSIRQKKEKENYGKVEPFTHEEEGIKVTSKVVENREDRCKAVHNLETDPFVVKFNVEIICRILENSKNSTIPQTSSIHHEEKSKVHTTPLDAKTDDWDYNSTKQKLEFYKKETPSEPFKDSKPPKDNYTPPSELLKSTRGSKFKSVAERDDEKPKYFRMNSIKKDSLAYPPHPGMPLSNSQEQIMLPPSKTPPLYDYDYYRNEERNSLGYKPPENNPHFL